MYTCKYMAIYAVPYSNSNCFYSVQYVKNTDINIANRHKEGASSSVNFQDEMLGRLGHLTEVLDYA